MFQVLISSGNYAQLTRLQVGHELHTGLHPYVSFHEGKNGHRASMLRGRWL